MHGDFNSAALSSSRAPATAPVTASVSPPETVKISPSPVPPTPTDAPNPSITQPSSAPSPPATLPSHTTNQPSLVPTPNTAANNTHTMHLNEQEIDGATPKRDLWRNRLRCYYEHRRGANTDIAYQPTL
ncbi:hypothetical protein LWI29_021651 [Acer saccharum]|uniref:Uncharacterized protein n=1 Tax=Acer saccharum TaxID=4024 RepID=A0AA39W7H5_ACESA|nr:hypothetical protein LWI29_021651 [Acer saccharum]